MELAGKMPGFHFSRARHVARTEEVLAVMKQQNHLSWRNNWAAVFSHRFLGPQDGTSVIVAIVS